VTDPSDIRGLLFDKDGTILDYVRTWVPINRAVATYAARGDPALRDRALAAGGHDPVTDHVTPGSPFAGGTVAEIAAVVGAAVGATAPPDLDEETARLFETGGATHAVLIDRAHETLVALKAERFELGLATNDTAAGLEASLARFAILPLFDFTCGADSGFGAKPGPGMVEAFCRVCGVAAHEVAVIGDSVHDLAMGRAAGAGLCIGVLSGTGTREDLAEFADHLIDSIADLPALFAIASGAPQPKRMTRPWQM
jgi:phosphoglycolate phosphatase